mmetsp:Transcript_8991/g.13455  ORF Transcript_8991/g.13455 Transcript_8991/m.13455 type:complete len:163 (+) Transcript_8991:80-568(+)
MAAFALLVGAVMAGILDARHATTSKARIRTASLSKMSQMRRKLSTQPRRSTFKCHTSIRPNPNENAAPPPDPPRDYSQELSEPEFDWDEEFNRRGDPGIIHEGDEDVNPLLYSIFAMIKALAWGVGMILAGLVFFGVLSYFVHDCMIPNAINQYDATTWYGS